MDDLRKYLQVASRVFKLPFARQQDSAIDVEEYIARQAGERLGRTFAARARDESGEPGAR